ncbi:MAG: hypothetical protein SGILL_006956, partial [Bacillariaceae sp.]
MLVHIGTLFILCVSLKLSPVSGVEETEWKENPRHDFGDAITVASLTTEYLENPMGVDKVFPRVSWKLIVRDHSLLQKEDGSPRRGIAQKAYQLHVKVTPFFQPMSSCTSGEWKDCGWVQSNQTHLVPFRCDGITPIDYDDMDIEWKVSVQLNSEEQKDPSNVSGALESQVAKFRSGLFGSWQAQWITGGTLLRKEFSLPAHSVKEYATLFVSGIGYHHVYLDGKKVGDHQMDP